MRSLSQPSGAGGEGREASRSQEPNSNQDKHTEEEREQYRAGVHQGNARVLWSRDDVGSVKR